MRTLLAAEAAGAHCLVLCDTNGGCLPHEVAEIIREVKQRGEGGDAARHPRAQRHRVRGGDVAGRGGRGRSATCRGRSTATASAAATPTSSRSSRTSCSRWGSTASRRRTCASCATSRASSPSWPTASRGSSQPYVGDSAFAHKGGIHVSAVLKHPETYEHVDPDAVGNQRRVLVSELAGQSNVLWKAKEYGIDLDKNTPGGPAHPRDAQAARGRGLPVRGRGGLLRAPDGARPRQPPALLRARRAIASSWRRTRATASRWPRPPCACA